MKGGAILLAALMILGSAWAAFLFYQNRGHVQENHAAEYLLSALGVGILLLVAAGIGSLISERGESATGAAQGAGDGWVSRHGPGGILRACALGLAVMGLGVFGLAAAGLLSRAAVWVMVAVLGGLSLRRIAGIIRYAGAVWRMDRPGWGAVCFLIIIAAGLAVCLISCLAPLTANDSMVYHFNIPRIYLAEGGLARLPHNVYANMPHNGEVLYTMAYAAGGETGARLFYFAILLLAGGAVFCLARRLAGRLPALIASACFLMQPLILDHRVVGNVDVLLAYYYVAAVMVALDLRGRRPGPRGLVTLGILAGFMLGIKYTALLPCLTLLLPLLWARRPGLGIRSVGVAALVALVVFAPWPVKNTVYTGNPFYPVLEGVFDGANWDEVQGEQLVAWQRSMGAGRSAASYLLLPFNVSLRGKPGLNYTRFDGTLTPVFLCLLPFALFRRKRTTTLFFLMAAAGFIFWAATSQQLRFLIPTLALASAIAAAGVSNIIKWTGPRKDWAVFALLALMMVSGLVLPDQYGRPFASASLGERLPVVTGVETRQAYLERNVQPFSMFEYINASLPPGAPVFMIWENRGYYLDRPYLADSFFEASGVMRLAAKSPDPEALARRLSSMGFDHVLVNEPLGRFFSQRYSPGDRALLEGLVRSRLEAVHSANGLTLYTLKAGLPAGP
jgi:hypothetical protein